MNYLINKKGVNNAKVFRWMQRHDSTKSLERKAGEIEHELLKILSKNMRCEFSTYLYLV